jgi:hypothetical protein
MNNSVMLVFVKECRKLRLGPRSFSVLAFDFRRNIAQFSSCHAALPVERPKNAEASRRHRLVLLHLLHQQLLHELQLVTWQKSSLSGAVRGALVLARVRHRIGLLQTSSVPELAIVSI